MVNREIFLKNARQDVGPATNAAGIFLKFVNSNANSNYFL